MASILAGSGATPNAPSVPVHASPGRRAWRRFRANRLGYVSLLVFAFFFAVSLLAEVLSNDRPLVVRYNGNWYFPVLQTLPETTFGGDFPTPTDYLDPDIRANLAKPSNLVVYPPNRYHARTIRNLVVYPPHRYHARTINYFAKSPDPARPSAQNRLGTDAQGRDLLARLLYGFRLS